MEPKCLSSVAITNGERNGNIIIERLEDALSFRIKGKRFVQFDGVFSHNRSGFRDIPYGTEIFEISYNICFGAVDYDVVCRARNKNVLAEYTF